MKKINVLPLTSLDKSPKTFKVFRLTIGYYTSWKPYLHRYLYMYELEQSTTMVFQDWIEARKNTWKG